MHESLNEYLTSAESARFDQKLNAIGAAHTAQFDYEAGLRWDRYNAKWLVKLAGRSDRNAYVFEVDDQAQAIVERFMRLDKLDQLCISGPIDEIVKLFERASVFAQASRMNFSAALSEAR